MQIKSFLGKSINESVTTLTNSGYKVVVIRDGESLPIQLTDDYDAIRVTIVENNGIVKNIVVG